MAIAVFIEHHNLTLATFDEVDSHMREAQGGRDPVGLIHHFVYGTDGGLMSFEIWETEADFAAFGGLLVPILVELGIESQPPQVWPLQRGFAASVDSKGSA